MTIFGRRNSLQIKQKWSLILNPLFIHSMILFCNLIHPEMRTLDNFSIVNDVSGIPSLLLYKLRSLSPSKVPLATFHISKAFILQDVAM